MNAADNSLKLYLFHCANNFGRDEVVQCCEGLEGVQVKAIGLPCSGKVDVPYMMKAFETGADAAVLVGCARDECRHLEGFIRGRKRVNAVNELLEEIGLGSGRMMFVNPNGEGIAPPATAFTVASTSAPPSISRKRTLQCPSSMRLPRFTDSSMPRAFETP